MCKQGHTADAFNSVLRIPQTSEIIILGLTFQPNCKFSSHLKEKLYKANKCLYVVRCLRKEVCSQAEVDHLFSSIVLPNITYALSQHMGPLSQISLQPSSFQADVLNADVHLRSQRYTSYLKCRSQNSQEGFSYPETPSYRANFPEIKSTRYNLRNKDNPIKYIFMEGTCSLKTSNTGNSEKRTLASNVHSTFCPIQRTPLILRSLVGFLFDVFAFDYLTKS